MKNFFTALLTLCCISLFADAYNFIALGDIHFDGAQYHKLPPQTAGRKKERQRNLSMWESGKSAAVLSAAAAQAKSSKPAFVVQLGDFTQGDCDTPELQEQMFADGFAKVKSFFPGLKLFPVKGNHDVR
ncbi:MAG: metallophosphoesterase, partial [Lentisphaeria bacterium]|nr:metallophosphoesterase [Lentisphaeria bacterium]